MKQIVELFRVRKQERWIAAIALLLFIVLNILTIMKYYEVFTPLHGNYWNLFIGKFHVSGFDPITYDVVSDWEARYNVYRHPLLSFVMYIPYLINRGLMMLTGMNCVQFVVAALLITAACYAAIFLYRICYELIELKLRDAALLTAMLFSFGFVMLATMVPDHFVYSLFALLLTLYVSGRLIKEKRRMTGLQTIALFVLTAGISLNNGIKTYISALTVNGRKFFRWRYLLLYVLIPSALMWGFCRFEYRVFVWPGEQARHAAKAKKKAEQKKKEIAMQKVRDSLALVAAKDSSKVVKNVADSTKKAAPAPARKKKVRKQGTPLMQGEFMRWTDITTDRWTSTVENLFGESIQLHEDHLLEDVMRNRPVIVTYRHWWNYGAEALLVLCFVVGLWMGRRSRLLWMTVGYALLDMALHMGLGFGINEVYIMTPHWIYVMPIAMAFLMKNLRGKWLAALRMVLLMTVVYLYVWNGMLIVKYMIG